MIQSSRYSIEVIQKQARRLVNRNVISRQQCIYTLCQFIPASEWARVELELEEYDFLLRDRIADLIGDDEWQND
ncbi:DUF4327 family protein [Allocoleopsis sp.]|uniref:DUF4327 family protein n=1 Tax=Allocoleopsis sp. TaxID=3088169 RepID=UPI002FD4A64F